jgi:hypothetical protein
LEAIYDSSDDSDNGLFVHLPDSRDVAAGMVLTARLAPRLKDLVCAKMPLDGFRRCHGIRRSEESHVETGN